MSVRYRGREDVADSVGLLFSILVRYPEVATINFDPDRQVLSFNFIIAGLVDQSRMDFIERRLLDSIEVFNKLSNKKIRLSLVQRKDCDCFNMIEIQRDVETLVREEIALIVVILRQYFENILVTDENSPLLEEDLLIQEEIIEHMLESVKGYAGDKEIFAFREEGRVMVFNK